MRHLTIPFSNSKISTVPGLQSRRVGRGMGSVLLQPGGPGAASSYPSVESYESTTGRKIEPMMSAYSGKGLGAGLKAKIRALIPKPTKERKPANINFSL